AGSDLLFRHELSAVARRAAAGVEAFEGPQVRERGFLEGPQSKCIDWSTRRERRMTGFAKTGRMGGLVRSLLCAGAIVATAALALPAEAAPPKTVEPGKLTVGFNGDMPMTSWKDGKLIGTDGELLAQIAANLG